MGMTYRIRCPHCGELNDGRFVYFESYSCNYCSGTINIDSNGGNGATYSSYRKRCPHCNELLEGYFSSGLGIKKRCPYCKKSFIV